MPICPACKNFIPSREQNCITCGLDLENFGDESLIALHREAYSCNKQEREVPRDKDTEQLDAHWFKQIGAESSALVDQSSIEAKGEPELLYYTADATAPLTVEEVSMAVREGLLSPNTILRVAGPDERDSPKHDGKLTWLPLKGWPDFSEVVAPGQGVQESSTPPPTLQTPPMLQQNHWDPGPDTNTKNAILLSLAGLILMVLIVGAVSGGGNAKNTTAGAGCATDTDCPRGQACSYVHQPPKCAPIGGVGAPCVDESECKEGLFCLNPDGTPAMNGGTCRRSRHLKSGESWEQNLVHETLENQR